MVSIDNKYNTKLRKMMHDLDRSPASSANYPEMLPMKVGGRKPRSQVPYTSLPYAPPLSEVLEAERELRSNPMYGDGFFENVGKHVKDTAKSVEKATKKVGKKAVKATKQQIEDVKEVAEKIAKSKAVKTTGRVAKSAAKKTATLALDIGEKAAPALGGIAGASLAVATLNPELAPAASAIGAAVASELSKRGRKEVKKQTGLGVVKKLKKEVKEEVKETVDKLKKKLKKEPKVKVGGGKPPNAWVSHVKSFAKEHGMSYKDALSKAKSSYKK